MNTLGRFKLFLELAALRSGEAVDPLPKLPPGKRAIDLSIDFLACLWGHIKEQITRGIGVVADLNAADVWLISPQPSRLLGMPVVPKSCVMLLFLRVWLVQMTMTGVTDFTSSLTLLPKITVLLSSLMQSVLFACRLNSYEC